MSIATLVIGESGTGKTASLRNFDPATTLLIQCQRKPLPFKAPGWGLASNANKQGNIIVTDLSAKIIETMTKTRREVIILDDFQYMMTNEFMRRSEEQGYQKFSDIGRHAWDVLSAAAGLPAEKRVYILGHTATDDFGKTRAKTVGKLLDEKISVEGMFTIVLKTVVEGGDYFFATRNNGADTTKTPMDLFPDDLIPNDLAAVDHAICEYYDLAEVPA
jgi:hypothetical protein